MTGEPKKISFGPWMLGALGVLARFKGLRGTAFDIFGRSAERQHERQLIVDYEKLIEELIAGLNQETHRLAIALATIPEHIRGYGHVKERHLAAAKKREAELLATFRNPAPQSRAAQ